MNQENRILYIEKRLDTIEQRLNVLDIGKKNVNIKIWRDELDQINVQTVIVRPETGRCELKSQTWNPIKLLTRGSRHKNLYNKDVENENHEVSDFKSFMNVILGEKGKRTFTYCFKSNGDLNMCETLHEIDDNKCKHMYVCYDKQHICSAGIIVFKRFNDSFKIYIDNMSGTYFTREDDPKILKTSIASSFPSDVGIEDMITTINPRGNERDKEIFCSSDGTDEQGRPTRLFENSIDFFKICDDNIDYVQNRDDILPENDYSPRISEVSNMESTITEQPQEQHLQEPLELLVDPYPETETPDVYPYNAPGGPPQEENNFSFKKSLKKIFGLSGAKHYKKKHMPTKSINKSKGYYKKTKRNNKKPRKKSIKYNPSNMVLQNNKKPRKKSIKYNKKNIEQNLYNPSNMVLQNNKLQY